MDKLKYIEKNHPRDQVPKNETNTSIWDIKDSEVTGSQVPVLIPILKTLFCNLVSYVAAIFFMRDQLSFLLFTTFLFGRQSKSTGTSNKSNMHKCGLILPAMGIPQVLNRQYPFCLFSRHCHSLIYVLWISRIHGK